MAISDIARNRVVSRTVNGIVTSYAYDGWNLIEDYDANGNELARYIHGPKSDEILAKISPTGAVYYIQDGNQNVTTITDGTGLVVERYTYDVYGAATITDGAGNVLTVSGQGNRFMFTGRETSDWREEVGLCSSTAREGERRGHARVQFIAEIGIYDYRNRVYSPGVGRFLQTDPIRFQAGDINIYRYVGNSPVNWTDPLGLCPNAASVPPGYAAVQTGTAGLDTDGAGHAAATVPGHKPDPHDPTTSLQYPDGTYPNGDIVKGVAQNANGTNANGTPHYDYPPGTPVYAVNNDTGAGAPGIITDNATTNNNANNVVEVTPAMGNALGVTQTNSRGQIQNSTTGASISVYYYPKK